MIKKQRDPRNVFSFASRVSWSRSLSGPIDLDDDSDSDSDSNTNDNTGARSGDNDDATISTDIHEAESVRDGEIQPTHCLTPQRNERPPSPYGMDDAGDDPDVDADDAVIVEKNSKSSDLGLANVAKLADDVRRLLSLTSDSDEDLKDWSLAPVPLQRNDFDGRVKDDDDDNDSLSF